MKVVKSLSILSLGLLLALGGLVSSALISANAAPDLLVQTRDSDKGLDKSKGSDKSQDGKGKEVDHHDGRGKGGDGKGDRRADNDKGKTKVA